ncbi:MAG: hypothetical protein ACLFT7_08655 [Thermoplasmata archaeon]
MKSDIKLEKALDLVIAEFDVLNRKNCPLYEFLIEFRGEISEENLSNLKTELPVPDSIDCKDCPIED